MTEKEVLSSLAGVLMMVTYVPYIIAILFWDAKPSRATWITWATLDVMVTAAMYRQGTLNVQMVGAASGAVIVAILSLRYGLQGWGWLDIGCLIAATIGAILWATSGDADISLIANCFAMAAGAIPTFCSAYSDPSNENRWAWLCAFTSCVLQLMAMREEEWKVRNALQPITFTFIETVVSFLVWVRPLWKWKTPKQKQ